MSDMISVILSPEAVKRQLAGTALSRLMMRGLLELEAAQLVKISADDAQKLSAILPKAADMHLADSNESALVYILSGENTLAKVPALVEDLEYSFGKGLFSVPADKASNADLMKLLSNICRCSNLITPEPAVGEERTLLIIKPENFRQPSCRPGSIIDILMGLDLKWVGCKVHGMSIDEALEFYAPVRPALRKKLGPRKGSEALKAVEEMFKFKFSPEMSESLIEVAGNGFADDEFERLVEFMAGKRPCEVTPAESGKPAGAKCMVLIFDGVDAVGRIRKVLGPTNPAEASGGTVRYDFGTNIMVNAAHASDAVESYTRESAIVKVNENRLSCIAADHK